jgi:hypothetical protein
MSLLAILITVGVGNIKYEVAQVCVQQHKSHVSMIATFPQKPKTTILHNKDSHRFQHDADICL